MAGCALSPRPLECPSLSPLPGSSSAKHAVAVARQHAHVRDDAPAAAARSVAEQDGCAVARRDVPGREPAPVAHGDADLLVRDADGGLVDRPPRRVRDLVAEGEGQQRELGHDRRAGDPPGRVGGAPAQAGPARCAVRRRDGREAGRDEQQPARDVADAGDVAPVGARVDDVQPVRDDPEADGDQPDDDAQRDAGRSCHAGLGERPRRRERDDGRDAECRRVGAREGEVEQVRHDEREAGEQERALGTREPLAPTATRRRGGLRHGRSLGALGVAYGGRHALTVSHRRPVWHRGNPWRRWRSTDVSEVRAAPLDRGDREPDRNRKCPCSDSASR